MCTYFLKAPSVIMKLTEVPGIDCFFGMPGQVLIVKTSINTGLVYRLMGLGGELVSSEQFVLSTF